MINKLINKIKSKKELSGISNAFVKDYLTEYIKKNNIDISNLGEKEIKLIVSHIRAKLRRSVGEFQSSNEKDEMLIETEDIDELLKSHSSTKERMEDYNKVKEIVYESKPKSILDLGCGLNPIAVAKPGVFYYACDVDENALKIANLFFKKKGIEGKAFTYDLRRIEDALPKADVCLILKVFDALEKRGHKLAEKILKNVKSKIVIISFSTKTLSGKPMNHPQRGWIERLLERLNYKFEIIKLKNEIFYVAKEKH